MPKAVLALLACALLMLQPGTVAAQDANALVADYEALIQQGRAEEAEQRARAAYGAAMATHGEESPEVADTLLPLAYTMFANDKSSEAVAELERRIAITGAIHGAESSAATRAISDLVSALIPYAETLEQSGDYATAEQVLEKIVASYTVFRGEGNRETLSYRRRLGTAIKNQGRPADAEPIMRRTLELAEENLGPGDVVTLDLLNDLGRAIEAQQRHSEAEALYREAYTRGQENFGADDASVLVYGQNLGASLNYQGRLEEAEPIIRDTLERRRRVLGAEHPHTLYSMSDLAAVLMLGKRFDEAGEVLEAMVPAYTRVFGSEHPDTMSARNFYAVYLDQTGASPAKALAEARDAADLLRMRRDAIGLDPRGQRSLSTFTENDAFYFKTLLHALRRSGDLQDLPQIERIALFYEAVSVIQEAMESPANMAVVRRAAERAAAKQGPGLAAIAARRDTLSDRWAALASERSALMASGGDTSALNQTISDQQAVEAEIEAIDTQFEEEFPQYFNLLRPRPIEAPEVQEMTRNTDEAVLLVLPTEFGTHVIAIAGGTMDWAVSEYPERVMNEILRRLRWDLGASVDASPAELDQWLDEGSGAYPFDRRLAYALYQQLIAPVEWVFEGRSHVYVVAGGGFSSLPFGVLVTEEPKGEDGNPADLRTTSWLADKYALVQLPSLQSLAFLREFAEPGDAAAEGFLGFGDPALQGEARTRGGKAQRRNAGSAQPAIADAYLATETTGGLAQVNVDALRLMSRLPGTARELEEMRQILGAPQEAVVTGAAATETAVKQADLSSASILAFATHGLLAGEVDGATEPGLVMTPPDRPNAVDDGLLTMTEIATLDMGADWVILSACNTAAGDGAQGATGLSGLAKSFFLAGAQSLLASHWPVRDDVAAKLTVRTIAIAKENPGWSRAQALQQAMREIRNDASRDTADDTWAHPNAWAPFTLIGDARTGAMPGG